MKIILVVDDDSAVREVIAERLSMLGYHTVEAASGEEGLQKAIAVRPAGVVSDVVMAPGTGFDLLHGIRQCPELRLIPFFLTSSRELIPSLATAAESLQAKFYLKPSGLEEMYRDIKEGV